jgi:4-alpha-glucanotransferase
MTNADLLELAAAACGIEPEYTDTWGRRHQTPDEVKRAILAALGFQVASAEAIERDLDESAARQWAHPLDPTLVVRDDADFIRLRVPADRQGDSVKLEIEWENGDLEHHWHWMPELQLIEPASATGSQVLAKRLPLPKPLRLGYHWIRMYWVKEPELEIFAEARLIVCPRRAYPVEGRMAGVALSLYGLRSARNWGCGDFTDLHAVVDAFAPAGAALIALNPLHAIANRQPYNTSPYLPQSAFFRNFIYLDVEKVGEFHPDDAMTREIEALRATGFVEYERVAAIKLAALWCVFERFVAGGGSVEFDAYVKAEGQLLHDYTVYCALDEEMHRLDPNIWVWTDWPECYRDPRSPVVHEFAQKHQDRILFFKFLQWHIARQAAEAHAYALKRMRIGLYHDLALATDRYGADLWANRQFFVAGCRVGAPPDAVAPSGQDWAFPPPDRDQHRRDGYQLFAQSIRTAAKSGGALRIDHVMRFVRLYWIPQGMDARRGAYVLDHAQDLLGIVALESVRGKFVVVGEDLGTVTGEVRQTLAEAGVLSYRLLWFERNPDGSFRRPQEYPAHALVSSTTHDLPTLSGFGEGRDIEARRQAGLIDEAAYEAQKAARADEKRQLEQALADAGFTGDPLGFLLSTPCALAIVNQEDLSGETEQQNLPGSTWQYPNWRRKMRVTVEQLAPLAEKLKALLERSGRCSGSRPAL